MCYGVNFLKGFTYLIASTVLVVIILMVFLAQNDYSYQDQQELYHLRIQTMNNFINDLDQDVARSTYIASFLTLLSLE